MIDEKERIGVMMEMIGEEMTEIHAGVSGEMIPGEMGGEIGEMTEDHQMIGHVAGTPTEIGLNMRDRG